MTKDKLSSETLTYIDNLKVQISQICSQYNLQTKADLDALADRTDIDLTTIKKLRQLGEKLKQAVETNETPVEEKTAESARSVYFNFDNFFSDIQEQETNPVQPHIKHGSILALARAGEPRLAWDIYQKTPRNISAASGYSFQSLVAIFEAGAKANVETIPSSELIHQLKNWSPGFSSVHGHDLEFLKERLLLDFFKSASETLKMDDFAINHILPEMKYVGTKMYALDFAESFMTGDAYKHAKRQFDAMFQSIGKQIQIEYHSLQYVKYGYSNAPNEDTHEQIKTLAKDTTQGPIVQIYAAVAFARMGLADEAFFTHFTLGTPGGIARSSIGMAAAFLEGPHVDVDNAKKALDLCSQDDWYMAGDEVLKIIRPLVDAGEIELVKNFITAYIPKGKRSAELLLQAMEVYTDAGLVSVWILEELGYISNNQANQFAIAATRTTKRIRSFKREVKNIRKLKPEKLTTLLKEYPDDGDVQDGVVLSMSKNDLSNFVIGTIRDPHRKSAIQRTRQDLEDRYGEEFLDLLVYSEPFE